MQQLFAGVVVLAVLFDVGYSTQCYNGMYIKNMPKNGMKFDADMPQITSTSRQTNRNTIECPDGCASWGIAAYGRIFSIHGCRSLCDEIKKIMSVDEGSSNMASQCMNCQTCHTSMCNRPETDDTRDEAKCDKLMRDAAEEAGLTEEETRTFLAFNRNPTNGMDLNSATNECYNGTYRMNAIERNPEKPDRVKCDGKCTKMGFSAFGTISNTLACVPKDVPYCKVMSNLVFSKHKDCLKCEECDTSGCNKYDTDDNKQPGACRSVIETALQNLGTYSQSQIDRMLEALKKKYGKASMIVFGPFLLMLSLLL